MPPYPVDALVEARWRGGSKFYPAIVLAVGNNGETQTVNIEYCDDSDQELEVPVESVRPASRRLLQRYQQCINQIVAALLHPRLSRDLYAVDSTPARTGIGRSLTPVSSSAPFKLATTNHYSSG